MAKFKGVVCYGFEKEAAPGVYKMTDEVPRTYYGDWIRMSSKFSSTALVDDLTLSNVLSILADKFANDNFGRIIYIVHNNTKWKVIAIEEKAPRLLLTIGGVYHGE